MTNHEKIWHACKSLDKNEFNFEDIVMACYVMYKESFRMNNYDEPDTRQMAQFLSGPRSVLKKGILLKASASTYKLGVPPLYCDTRGGLNKKGLDKKLLNWLHRLINCSAAAKTISTITLIDVMQALGIKQISGLGRTALVDATQRIRQIEMDGSIEYLKTNLAKSVLAKITPLVDRYDKGAV